MNDVRNDGGQKFAFDLKGFTRAANERACTIYICISHSGFVRGLHRNKTTLL